MDANMSTDAGIVDASSVDGAAMHAAVVATIPALAIASVQVTGGGTALPDYSCRRAWDQAPTGGATIMGRINFDYGGPLGVTVDLKVFPSNDVPYDQVCTGSCFTTPTDTNGSTALFATSAGRFNAFTSPTWTAVWGDTYLPTAYYFVESESFTPDRIRIAPPSTSETQTYYARSSVSYLSTYTTLTGHVLDCDGAQVKSAVVRVFDADGLRYDSGPPAMRYGLISSATALPSVSTSENGAFVGFDLRPSDPRGTPMRIEAWANLGGGSPELVACERVRVFGPGLVDVNMRALRTSSPSDCTP